MCHGVIACKYTYPLLLHYATLDYTTRHYYMTHHDTKLHDITLHYMPVHYTILHYTTRHDTTVHCMTTITTQLHDYTLLRSTTRHYTTQHDTILYYILLYSTTRHYMTLHYITLNDTAPRINRQTDRQIDRYIDRQIDRSIDRQIDVHYTYDICNQLHTYIYNIHNSQCCGFHKHDVFGNIVLTYRPLISDSEAQPAWDAAASRGLSWYPHGLETSTWLSSNFHLFFLSTYSTTTESYIYIHPS